MKRIVYIAILALFVLVYGCDDTNKGRVAVQDIQLNPSVVVLAVGKEHTLKPTFVPADATYKTVVWECSDESVVKMSNGKLTPLKEGRAIVTVTARDGDFTAQCEIIVAKGMTMTTTTKSGEIKLFLAGSGAATIDWGDGHDNDSHFLHEYASLDWQYDDIESKIDSKYEYTHNYGGSDSRPIMICGENITHLACSYVVLTDINVSDNSSLKYLDCSYNQEIDKLNISKNTELTHLYCSYNILEQLDIDKNLKLEVLHCGHNQLTGIDVSNNKYLKELRLYGGNQVSTLNIDNNTDLLILDCKDNNLKHLDITHNNKLVQLYCGNNDLQEINVSGHTGLTHLDCGNNRITVLSSISSCASLIELKCNDNELSALNVSNNQVLEILDCRNNSLSTSAINTLFGTLHSNPIFGKIIYIAGNLGEGGTEAQQGAKTKGWNVSLLP